MLDLQKDNLAQLIITITSDTTTEDLKKAEVVIRVGMVPGLVAAITGSYQNITINSGFVDAKSKFGAGTIVAAIRDRYVAIKSGSINTKSMNGA